MKKIIKHGKTEKYIHTCSSCGCVFTYELGDLVGFRSVENAIVDCPCCKNKQSTAKDTLYKKTCEQQTPRHTSRENASVSLISKMQQQIDTFKASLLHINERINNGNKCNLVYTEPLDDIDKHFINNIIRFIDEHEHAPEKDRTLEDIVAPAFKNDKAGLEDYCSKMNDAAKKLGIDPLNCSVEDAIKICDEFDKTKAGNQTTVFDLFPQIRQSNAINIVVKSPIDDFTTDPEAELNEDDLNDIPNVLAKNRKHGYVTVSPTNKDNLFRKTFIEPNLNEKGFLRQDRFATELVSEDGFLKYMLFFPWSKLNNQNAPYNEK